MLGILLLACAGNAEKGDQTEDTADTPGGTAPPEEAGEIPAIVAQGEVTWTLDFDETAEASGLYDCSYTRTFEGVQYLDMGYLCPTCVVQARGTATMAEGLDCYAQISADAAAERTELWGWSETAFFRAGYDQYPLGELAPITDAGEGAAIPVAWTSESELTAGGTMILSAEGSFSYTTDPGVLLPDPWPEPPAEYACGWESNDPGDLELDYDLAVGQTFPNVRLQDQCGEKLALWDLYGSWLVLDSSQSDCGPCRSMAEGAETFVAQMRNEGYDVKVVSLLGNGLSDPFGTPDDATFNAWVNEYELTDPVLYDRGFAYALFPAFVEEYTGETFGYPTWLVIDPQMRLVHGNIGFGSWDDVADIIRIAAQ